MRTIFCILIVATSLAIPPVHGEQPTTQPAEPQRVTLFAAVVKPGPAWLEAQAAARRPDMSRHLAYTAQLRSEGKLVIGGPFGDGTGGLLVYRAASLEDARSFLENDPAVIEKFFDAELHPWLVNAADVRD